MSGRGGEVLISLSYNMPATKQFRTSNILHTKKVLRLFVSKKKEASHYAFVPIQCRGRFRYDPKSEIKTQTRSNAVYPKELLLSKVENSSDRIEWKKRQKSSKQLG